MKKAQMNDEFSDLTITSVETQKRSRHARRSVFINHEFAFGISEEMYVKYALFAGRKVDREYLALVRGEEDFYQAKQAALRLLNYRLRSRKELESRLRDKEFTPEVIERTVEFLKGYDMIDDARFAAAFVNDLLLKKILGRSRLRAELRGKGIHDDTVKSILQSAVSDDLELENARRAAQKKLRTVRTSDPKKTERALVNYLAAKGFGWDVIRKITRESGLSK